jgi:WD40 repeat protein
VAISPDGERIVSGSADQTVRVWDARNGAELAVLHGHEDGVNSVTFSPDGGRIVSAGGEGDRTLRVWDAATGAELLVLRGRGPFGRASFSPDGHRIAVYSGDEIGTIWVFEADTGRCVEVIQGWGDIAAIAGGATRFPLRALIRGLETVIEASASGQPVARFPIVFGKLIAHPLGRAWAGAAGSHVYIFGLEGVPPDAAEISRVGSQER